MLFISILLTNKSNTDELLISETAKISRLLQTFTEVPTETNGR